jgi:hypothetical protein
MKPDVGVEVINHSSYLLENALVRFGDYACEWGYVAKDSEAWYGFYPHPITADVELRWDEAGKHRVVKLDLRKIYSTGESERLTFVVSDERVDASFKEGSP